MVMLKRLQINKKSRFPVKNYIIRYLTQEEESRLMGAAPDYFKPLLITALQTGLRKGNLINLKWEQIDFVLNIIKVPENKGNGCKK